MTSIKEEELNLEQCQTDERYGLGLVVGGGLINYKSLDSISTSWVNGKSEKTWLHNSVRNRPRLAFCLQSCWKKIPNSNNPGSGGIKGRRRWHIIIVISLSTNISHHLSQSSNCAELNVKSLRKSWTSRVKVSMSHDKHLPQRELISCNTSPWLPPIVNDDDQFV